MGTKALRLLIFSFPQGLGVSYIDKFSFDPVHKLVARVVHSWFKISMAAAGWPRLPGFYKKHTGD